MNYPPNTTMHAIGALVLHDADKKTERYLMVVDNREVDNEGVCWVTTHYLVPSLHRKHGELTNPLALLHDCEKWIG